MLTLQAPLSTNRGAVVRSCGRKPTLLEPGERSKRNIAADYRIPNGLNRGELMVSPTIAMAQLNATWNQGKRHGRAVQTARNKFANTYRQWGNRWRMTRKALTCCKLYVWQYVYAESGDGFQEISLWTAAVEAEGNRKDHDGRPDVTTVAE